MKKHTTVILLLLPFGLITGIVLVSVWNVLIQSLGYIPAFGLTAPTFSYYAQVFTRSDFLSAVWVSIKIAVWSTALSAVFGVLIAMALIKCRKHNTGMIYAVRLPILVPHAVVAVFVIQILSQTGLAARIFHFLGILKDHTQFPQLLFTPSYLGTVLAYLWKEIPFVAYFILAFMSGISDTLGEAAENLGASSFRSFWEVTLPLSVPVISRACLIIFIFAFGGYELPLLLGSTLPKALAVQTHLVYMSPDLLQRPLAMAMNGVVLILSASMALIYSALIYLLNRKIGGVK